MSGIPPNNNNRNQKFRLRHPASRLNQSRPTSEAQLSNLEVSSTDDQNFPALGQAGSNQTATATTTLQNKQPTASSTQGQQTLTQKKYSQFSNRITGNDSMQPLMPSTQLMPQTATTKKPTTEEKFPVTTLENAATSDQSTYILSSKPTTIQQTQPTNMQADKNNPRNDLPRPLTPHENAVNTKLCELILTMHGSKELVTRERVQREMFNYFRVNNWQELRVHPSSFTVLMNLSDAQKDVTFYTNVFEHVFNLCTLHDFNLLLVKFLKNKCPNIEKYEDLRLGPLEKNPEVQRVFEYRLTDPGQSIPTITTGQVIQQFFRFQEDNRFSKNLRREDFLDYLVKSYQLQSREQLGVFCRSLPFLVHMTNNLRQEQKTQTLVISEELKKEFIQDLRARLAELKEEMCNETQVSAYHKKRTPTAVFNYLLSIVEKYFNFIPYQPALYIALTQLRDDELLRCLFNISIYLGTIDTPEVFINELKKLYGSQNQLPTPLIPQQQLSGMDKKKRKAIQGMVQQQQQQQQLLLSPSLQPLMGDQNPTTYVAPVPPVMTSFAGSLLTSQPEKSVPLEQLCSYIYNRLVRYENPLTIKELLKVEERLCEHYEVRHFSALNYGNEDDANRPTDFVSFLDEYRQKIDPHTDLSVYEQVTSINDCEDLYSFVQQLSVLNDNETHDEYQPQHIVSADGHVNTSQVRVSAEKLSAIEQAIKHKFHGSIHFRKGNQIIKKVKQQQHHKHKNSVIRFEESLLDINGLQRLNICPISFNVDEHQLCQLILHCPLMIDLHTWFQWLYFFQPKYDALKSFITKHEADFKDLRLLETSTQELFRLPIHATSNTFEHELHALNIRSAVGHLCALIVQDGLVTRFSYNVYRTTIVSWFHRLQSLATLEDDQINPLQCILDFLMYLPVLIGQARIVEELILGPLDDVFRNDSGDRINARIKIWNMANVEQRMKLELWGQTININEWKNENKWLGREDSEAKSESKLTQKDHIDKVTSVRAPLESPPTTPVSEISLAIPCIPMKTFTTDENSSAQAAFEHIEEIRRGFGVNSGLDSIGQSIVTNLQGMIARSLKELSTDLYSDQGHFVLELIQNADDNQYPIDYSPTLRFILSPERILVYNNEVGFQRENIAAICNVGASTKGKHKEGYAGHKGIGFKSVFMVSTRPEIHSRNYHIRFDTMNGKDEIGYVRPIWIDQLDEELPNSDEWTTCIRLPIKQDAGYDRLQENFDNIQARLLLFLNRLRQIEIIDQKSNRNKRLFTRIDHAQGQIIELQEKTNSESVINNLWLVVKKVIIVRKDIKEKLRDVKGKVDSTTIAIAYPLSGIQECTSSFPRIQPVFAYLPLRSYRFRFILQADFEIPATRQEIRRDSLWNEWLKTEMTCLLSEAYKQFKRLPDLLASSSINSQISNHLTPIQTIKYFLKFIPSRNDVDAYFNAFVDESIKLLMGIIELPISRLNENNEIIIDWVSPSKCVVVGDPFIQKIVSQDLLISHFNRYYIHEQITPENDEQKQVLFKLGCRHLDSSDIIQLIDASYKQTEQERPKTTTTIEQIAQWLVCLDYSFQQQREQMHLDNEGNIQGEKETINNLKLMKIIPIKQQSYLVSVADFDKHAISFPLDKSIRYSTHLKLVLEDIPTVDEQLFNIIEDKYPQRLDSIKRLLLKLGITETRNIRDIYRQHMLPVMSDSTRWSSKSDTVLVAYLMCIYEYIHLSQSALSDNDLKTLRNKMIIKTRDNRFVSLGTSDLVVHLTSTYGCKKSLESLNLPKHQFIFISDDYYTQYRMELFRSEAQMHTFVTFLKDLNMSDFLQINFKDESFFDVSKLAETQWAYLIPQLSEVIYEPFIIKDCICEEFDKLVQSLDENQTDDRDLCAQLLKYLHNQHRSVTMYYSASIYSARGYKHNPTPIQGIESSFCLSLRRHAWIPVVGGQLLKPADVYLLSSDHQTSVFRRYLPHLDDSKVTFNNQDFIYNILGINSQVTHRTIFELFMKWSCNLDSESLWNLIRQTNTNDIIPCTIPSTFRQSCLDTIENFNQIYQFLASSNETCSLINRFRLWPLIFIPRDQNTGDFLFVHQTFWNDPLALLSQQQTISDAKGRIPIRSFYDSNPTLQAFFLDVLQVEHQPTIDDYLPLLSSVQNADKIWEIIERITILAKEQNKQKEVRDRCLDIEFIPCINNQQKLMKYTDHLFYPHDADIVDLFADTLSIIKLPSSGISTEFKDEFCLLFDIKNLADVIQTKVIVENEQISTNLVDFYSHSIELIQSFLLDNNLILDARSAHLASIFSRMQFISVDQIHLSYCYNTNIIKTPSTTSIVETYIDQQASKFYILKKYETSEMRFIDAMTDFIVEDENIRGKVSVYIKKLLQIYQNSAEQGLNQMREKLIRNYEPKWIIQKVIGKNLSSSSPKPEETTEKPVVTKEEIQRLADEPLRRVKTKTKEGTEEKDSERLTIFPLRTGVNELYDTSKTRVPSKSQMDTKLLDGSIPVQEGENNEHVERKRRDNKYTAGDEIRKESNNEETTSSKDRTGQSQAAIVFSDETSLPPVNFERILVSTFTDLEQFISASAGDDSSISNSVPVIGSDTDRITGRQGEELVYRYLKWKYPDENIEWINEKNESGGPYDIRMTVTSDNNRVEFIEVKTTRAHNQNTFLVSVGEVEYLLQHPSNYSIYRVYFADNMELSTITEINEIKDKLQKKYLKLSMTMVSNTF